jgi:hypothetical protein
MQIDPALAHEELTPKKTMPLIDIVKKDLKVNHKGEGITLEQAAGALEQFSQDGAKFVRFGNTLFIVTNPNDEAIIFHTVNADPPQIYLYNLLQFYAELYEQGKTQATSYFSNPKLIDFLEKTKLPNETITESDDPSRGSYMVIMSLTGGA